MENGILAGYNIDSMKVRIYDGSMHAVDLPIAFELCAKEGSGAAGFQAKPVILGADHETRSRYAGRIYRFGYRRLNRRRGSPKGQSPAGNAVAIQAEVPLSEMFGYA